jgi:DNA-binding transcriptional regulator YiaG
MKQNVAKAHQPKVRKSREDRAMLASRFRVLCADAGLSLDLVAQTLHVTPRTVRYWFSGKSAVPYAAYKLVRILRWFELPQKGFEGWCMHSGKLWTPEGIPIGPEDGGWWSLLVRQARCFRTLYQRSADFERALMMLTAKGLAASDAPGSLPLGEDAAAQRATRVAGGRGDGAARPGQGTGRRAVPPNLFKGHFRTREGENELVSLGKQSSTFAINSIAPISQSETGASHG